MNALNKMNAVPNYGVAIVVEFLFPGAGTIPTWVLEKAWKDQAGLGTRTVVARKKKP